MVKEYCNPLDLNYKYQHYGENAHREGADPTLIFFKGKYYLFVSMSAGFYYSDDLTHWNWHENRNLDIYHYAPDVRQMGAKEVFKQINPRIKMEILKANGTFVNRGDVIATIEGPMRDILRGERVALNFLQRMSGIAATTAKFVQELAGTNCKILDTRKTAPLLML